MMQYLFLERILINSSFFIYYKKILNQGKMANIFIQLQKPFYFAGQIVNGYVYLNVYQKFSGCQVDLKLKGWETVTWIQTRHVTSQQQINTIPGHLIYNAKGAYVQDNTQDSSDSEINQGMIKGEKYYYKNEWGQIHQIIKHYGQKIMVKLKIRLHNFGGEFIPSGQYSIPFSFKSGENWAGSYIDKSPNKQRKGRIKYQIKASIESVNGKKKKEIKYRTQIIIRQSAPIQAEIRQMNAKVVSCCCIDKGVSKIKCYFDKNAYSPGQDSIIHCFLDNTNSKANINQVKINLINSITYTSSKNYSKKFQIILFTKIFGGLPAGQKQQKIQQIKILNQNNSNKFDIKPTSRGHFLKSVYYLQVQAKLDALCTCCSQLPIINQSILIYPLIPINTTWNQPNNWQPKVLPNFIINMGPNSVVNEQIQQMKNLYY